MLKEIEKLKNDGKIVLDDETGYWKIEFDNNANGMNQFNTLVMDQILSHSEQVSYMRDANVATLYDDFFLARVPKSW